MFKFLIIFTINGVNYLKNRSVILIIMLIVSNMYLLYNYILLYNDFINLNIKLINLEDSLNMTKSQLEYYRNLYNKYYTEPNLEKEYPSEQIIKITFQAVAVKVSNEGYKGEILNFTLLLVPGEGKAFISTQPKVGIDLQASINVALKVAQDYTGLTINQYNVIVIVSAKEEIDVVDGPSAGGMLTIALIAVMQNKIINQSVFMTGTINPDGSIGRVGNIIEKAIAVAKAGGKIFLVPEGQKYDYIIEWKEIIPGLYVGVKKLVNVEEYLGKLGYHLKIVEVKYIWEAEKYLLISFNK